MRNLPPGAGHRAPDLVPIVGSVLICAITGRSQPMLRCSSCREFQGILMRPDPWVLCVASARPPRRNHRAGLRSRLIFDQDWPDD